MRTLINISLFAITFSAIIGCSQNICPAFQSYYILDEDTREKKFTYFGEDSLPRSDLQLAKKSQFGIIEEPVVTRIPPPIRNPFAKLNLVEPKVIYPAKVDSLEFQGDEMMFAEMDVVDTTQVEAVEEEGKVWHFNIEQEAYFKYIMKKVGLTFAEEDTLAGLSEMVEEGAVPPDSVAAPKKKKGLGGLLNKIKKKKDGESNEENEENNDPGSRNN